MPELHTMGVTWLPGESSRWATIRREDRETKLPDGWAGDVYALYANEAALAEPGCEAAFLPDPDRRTMPSSLSQSARRIYGLNRAMIVGSTWPAYLKVPFQLERCLDLIEELGI